MTPFVTVLLALLFSILLLLCCVLLLAYITYRMAFFQTKKQREVDLYRYIKDDGKPTSVFSKRVIDEIQTIPYDNIYIRSYDGLLLRARLYIKDENLPFAIAAHGYRSTPWIDFAGGAVMLMELGFNVVMIDQRACGESEGNTITFGLKESRDLISWADYIGKRWGEERKILLTGMSMGATSVLLASGQELPPSVIGITADCPYSAAEDIIKKTIGDMNLPAALLYPAVRLGALLFGRFDPALANASFAVRDAKVPIMIIHGERDGFVPADMSERIAKENPIIERHTFPEASHGMSFIYDYDRYKRLTESFIMRCGGRENEQNVN